VGIEAEGDRILSREEVVELADAVASSSGIATGIGTNRRDEAISKATQEFARAAAAAGLPVYPIVRVEAISEGGEDSGEDR
jgi:hypothetical protein